VGGRGSPDRALAQRSNRSAGGHVGVEHLKGAERRDDTLGVADPTPEHDRGCCLAAPARWRTPPAWFGAKAPPLPLGGGDLMIGRKKSPKTEIGILNVRLHPIGIRRRIWTYLAKGYNFVIVSYVFALK